MKILLVPIYSSYNGISKENNPALLADPIFQVTLIAVIFGCLFLAFWLRGRRDSHLMDPNSVPGSFEPHLKRYLELARLILTLATASVAFLLNFLTYQPADHVLTSYGISLQRAIPRSVLFLCATVFFLLLFMILLNFFYENFSHFYYLPAAHPDKMKGRGLYWRWKYALVLSCGYSGLLWFFVAYALLAASLFTGPR